MPTVFAASATLSDCRNEAYSDERFNKKGHARALRQFNWRINMKIIPVTVASLLVIGAAAYAADDTSALIALDKQWGESAVKGDTNVTAKLLADKVVSVTESGVRGKQGELADMKPEPAGTRYVPTDYKVTFINPDTAIMTHGTTGTDAHYSLHVWVRKGGTWQVVATSTTPAKSGK